MKFNSEQSALLRKIDPNIDLTNELSDDFCWNLKIKYPTTSPFTVLRIKIK